jgi:hypothetical protein
MDAMLIATFCGILWLPTADNLLHLDHSSAFNEKRPPATFPAFRPGLAGMQGYVQGLEAYFNDHFGWRKKLIRWHGSFEIAIFRKKTATEVVWGTDGWLYYFPRCPGNKTASRGPAVFSRAELESLRHTLECRRDWLACRNIAYVFVVAPDKQSVYPEHLPSWLKPTGAPNRLDQFLSYMRDRSNVTILDLRRPLRQAKWLAPTYYRTDSHWNAFGGYVASEEIVRTLSRQLPELHPVPLEAFRLLSSHGKGGDLADLIGICAEDEEVTLMPEPMLPIIKESVENPSLVRPNCYSTNASASLTAVVFRDSFGTALRPFLGYCFRNVCYIWTAKDFDPKLVEQARPNVVISEIAERNLDGLVQWN